MNSVLKPAQFASQISYRGFALPATRAPPSSLPFPCHIVFSPETRYKLDSARQRDQHRISAKIFPPGSNRLACVSPTLFGVHVPRAPGRRLTSNTGRGSGPARHKRRWENDPPPHSRHAASSHEGLRKDRRARCGSRPVSRPSATWISRRLRPRILRAAQRARESPLFWSAQSPFGLSSANAHS